MQSIRNTQKLFEQGNIAISAINNYIKMQRRYWSQQEDQTLRSIVQSMPDINWSLVSHHMMSRLEGCTRNPKQCRERWLNQLNKFSSDEIPWSSCENKLILQQYLKSHNIEKNKWIIIAQRVNQENKNGEITQVRTPNDIKNRFYSMIRKGIRKINNQIGRPILPEQIRLLKPVTTSKMLSNLNQQEYREYIQIIYQMASDNSSKQLPSNTNKEVLQNILCNVMEVNRRQQKNKRQKQQSKDSKKQNLKRRKSSLSTNQQDKILILKRQSSISSNYITNAKSQQIKIEHDFIDIYLRDFVEESASLQFQEIDFGL